MSPTLARVTVIIRTKNSAGILQQTLKALFSQSFLHFDLLIADSSSTDATLEIVKPYGCQVISIAAEDYFPGKVLNSAVEASSSEIVVFLNSDAVLLTPIALEELLRPFAQKNVQATFGRQLPRPDAKTWVKHDLIKSFPREKAPPSWMPYALPFAAMRKSIWLQRPFYTAAWGSEDTEWGHWAKSNQKQVLYVPSACVMHSHNYTLKQLYGRRFIEGEADAFIYGRQHSIVKMIGCALKSCLSDCIYHIRHGDLWGLIEMPWVRVVAAWAYYRGHRLGENRIRSGDPDAGMGQKEVLKRYD
jgi:rhamnosyltransferase